MRAAASLLVLVCACRAPGDRYEVHLDPAFTPDDADLVLRSLDEWRSAVPVTLTTMSDYCISDRPGLVCIHPGDPTARCAADHTIGGCTTNIYDLSGRLRDYDAPHDIYLLPSAGLPGSPGTPEYFQNMALHELGHAMALAHSIEGSIMNPVTELEPQPGRVTENDVAQWWEVRR